MPTLAVLFNVCVVLCVAWMTVRLCRRVWRNGWGAGGGTTFDLLVLFSLAVFVVSYSLSNSASHRDLRRWQAHIENMEAKNKLLDANNKLLEEANARVAAQPTRTAADQQRWNELQAEATRLIAEGTRLSADSQKTSLAFTVDTSPRVYSRIAMAAGILPVAWFIHSAYAQSRAKKRKAAGQCEHCGYDLCATPGRCPECGTNA